VYGCEGGSEREREEEKKKIVTLDRCSLERHVRGATSRRSDGADADAQRRAARRR
jgi:hypothetical protein